VHRDAAAVASPKKKTANRKLNATKSRNRYDTPAKSVEATLSKEPAPNSTQMPPCKRVERRNIGKCTAHDSPPGSLTPFGRKIKISDEQK